MRARMGERVRGAGCVRDSVACEWISLAACLVGADSAGSGFRERGEKASFVNARNVTGGERGGAAFSWTIQEEPSRRGDAMRGGAWRGQTNARKEEAGCHMLSMGCQQYDGMEAGRR